MAGFVLSSFFAGFTVGAVRSGRIIERIGHIRAYAAFAGLVLAATAVMALLVGPLPWLVLRAMVGFGCPGLFVTTESWLNAKAQPAERGRVFALYMVGTFIALAIGQLLIGRVPIKTMAPFNIVIALFAVALVMVCATRAEPPRTVAAAMLPYGQLARAAPVAVVGAALSGLTASAFYALVPVWMQGHGIALTTIGLFTLMAVLGGLAFQVPVGRLSDRVDRRVVLGALGFGFAVIAVVLVHLPRTLPVVLPGAVLLGGFMSTLYPVCVAQVLGPLLGMSLMGRFGIDGVFYLMAAALLLAVLASARSLLLASPPHLERSFDSGAAGGFPRARPTRLFQQAHAAIDIGCRATT